MSLPKLHQLCIAGVLAMFCLHARADVAPLPGGPQLQNCNMARDPTRCKARIEARKACHDKRGNAKRACMTTHMAAPDCAHATHARRCIARKKAEQACHGKQGRQFKSCVQAYREPAVRPIANTTR